jgi:hypothetical protein
MEFHASRYRELLGTCNSPYGAGCVLVAEELNFLASVIQQLVQQTKPTPRIGLPQKDVHGNVIEEDCRTYDPVEVERAWSAGLREVTEE